MRDAKPGDVVVVVGNEKEGIRVVSHSINDEGGVMLNRPVEGLRMWNEDALRCVKRAAQ